MRAKMGQPYKFRSAKISIKYNSICYCYIILYYIHVYYLSLSPSHSFVYLIKQNKNFEFEEISIYVIYINEVYFYKSRNWSKHLSVISSPFLCLSVHFYLTLQQPWMQWQQFHQLGYHLEPFLY